MCDWFDFLCLLCYITKSLILYVCFAGAVLLVSVQGIAINVDPIVCTWLLYQPHRTSSRQQQQVLDPSSQTVCRRLLQARFTFIHPLAATS